jgi:hypothetical protein
MAGMGGGLGGGEGGRIRCRRVRKEVAEAFLLDKGGFEFNEELGMAVGELG